MKNWKSWLQIGGTLGACVLLWQMVDFAELWNGLKRVHPLCFGMAALVEVGRQTFAVMRWGFLLRAKDIRVSFWKLSEYTFIGFFYNLFFPSIIGGDIVRTMALNKKVSQSHDVISSVFLDRLLSLSILCFMALVTALLAGPTYVPVQMLRAAQWVTLFFVVCGMMLSIRRLVLFMLSLLHHVRLSKLADMLKHIYEALYEYANAKQAVLLSALACMVYQLLGVLSQYMVGLSLGIEASFVYYLIFIPVVWLVIVIPVSVGGIGVREVTLVGLFASVGVSRENALLISLLGGFGLSSLLTGLLGGVVNLVMGLPVKQVSSESSNQV